MMGERTMGWETLHTVVLLAQNNKYWVATGGTRYEIKAMTNHHLENAMVWWRGNFGSVLRQKFNDAVSPRSHFAVHAIGLNLAVDWGRYSQKAPVYKAMQAELVRREERSRAAAEALRELDRTVMQAKQREADALADAADQVADRLGESIREAGLMLEQLLVAAERTQGKGPTCG